MYNSERKRSDKRSINIQREQQHGKGHRGNWTLFFCQWVLVTQSLIPADFWVPTQTHYTSSGVTSTSSLFSSFLFGFFTPPLLLVVFVTLFSGRSFLQDVAEPVLIRFVPTISCPSSRVTACSPLRTGSWCNKATECVCVWVCVGANLSPLCWVSIVFLMVFTWRTMFLLWSSSPVNLSSACVQHTSNNCLKIILHELYSQSVPNIAAHYFDSNFILNRGSNLGDQNPLKQVAR